MILKGGEIVTSLIRKGELDCVGVGVLLFDTENLDSSI